MKNLVTDKPAPITVALAQKADSDNVSTLFDSNVTRGNLKNLVTDKPAPITVALAQKADSDNVSTLFDSNVTRGNLKNLVTDKPAPITVALAQKGDVPTVPAVTVTTQTPTPATPPAPPVANLKYAAGSLVQTKSKAGAKGADGSAVFTLMDQNVTKGQMVNLITDKPSPITVALMQKQ